MEKTSNRAEQGEFMLNNEKNNEDGNPEPNLGNIILDELDTTDFPKQNPKKPRKTVRNRHAAKQQITTHDKSKEAIHVDKPTISSTEHQSKVGGHPHTSNLPIDGGDFDHSEAKIPFPEDHTQNISSPLSEHRLAYDSSEDPHSMARGPISFTGDKSTSSRPDPPHQSSEPHLLAPRDPALISRTACMTTPGAALNPAATALAPPGSDPLPRQHAPHGLNKHLRRIFPDQTPAAAHRRGSQQDGPWPRRQGAKAMSAEELRVKLWDPWMPTSKWRPEARFLGENRPGPPPPHPPRGAGAAPRGPGRHSPARGALGTGGAGGGGADGRAGGAGVEDEVREGPDAVGAGRRGLAGALAGAGLAGSAEGPGGPSSFAGAQANAVQ
jgi:hypothetical protein